MPEKWQTTKFSKSLSGRRSRDTIPETRLRQELHRLGMRFRLHRRFGRYTVDIIFPRYRLAVFVDGCFWHSCPVHGRVVQNGPNVDAWRKKFLAIKQRELKVAMLLDSSGYEVLRVWECEVRKDAAKIARYIQGIAVGSAHQRSPRVEL